MDLLLFLKMLLTFSATKTDLCRPPIQPSYSEVASTYFSKEPNQSIKNLDMLLSSRGSYLKFYPLIVRLVSTGTLIEFRKHWHMVKICVSREPFFERYNCMPFDQLAGNILSRTFRDHVQ